MSALLSQVNNAAHQGAFGKNPRSEPTPAQLAAGNYKKGVVTVHGLSIAIENPAYTYRKGIDKTGQQWMSLMQAHYGYIQGYKGNDGDEMDVFIGHAPENNTVYIVNQKTADGFFDEHKIMLGFLSLQQAVDTYQHCFDRGWTGLMSVIPCTMTQFKWWLANADKSRPVTLDRLPYAGLERLDSVIWGGNDGTDLASHSGQVHKLLYQIRQSDDTHQALEPLSYNDLVQELGNQGFVHENYDALVVEYNKLEKKAKQLLMVMQGAASTVKPVRVAVSKPLTKGGVANVVAWFEMDDGQAVGVFFHNPDKTPKRIDPTDEMISHKWVLNKKDITIAVAPENGKDLIVRTVAKRIMQLVEKNHDRFIKANSDKAILNQAEQDLTAQVSEKQATLKGLQDEVAALQVKMVEKEAMPTQAQIMPPLGFVGVWDSKSGQYPFQSITKSRIASFATREEAENDFKASSAQHQEPVTLKNQSAITVWDGQNADMRLAEILAQNNNDYLTASKAYFTEHLQGTSVQTKIGLVYLNSKSKGKMLHRLRKTTAQVIPRIPEILIGGNVGERELPNKERTDSFVAFYHFDKWLDFEDVRIHARIKVGEMPNGLLAYYLAASTNKEAPSFDSSWAENDESIKARSRTYTRLDAIQADDDDDVNIEILEVLPKTQAETTQQPEPVTLTGKELGDFPDTPEGKKELRAAAKAEFEKLLGEWVDCPALNSLEGENTKVEIRKRGMKEFLAFSGNPKKLKLVAEIANIIKTARVTSNSWQPNVKADTKRSAAGYYHLVNTIKMEDDTLNVTVIVEKDNNGLLHYDVLVPSNIADDLAAKKCPSNLSLITIQGVTWTLKRANPLSIQF